VLDHVRFKWGEVSILTHLDGTSWIFGSREPNQRLRSGDGDEDALLTCGTCPGTENSVKNKYFSFANFLCIPLLVIFMFWMAVPQKAVGN